MHAGTGRRVLVTGEDVALLSPIAARLASATGGGEIATTHTAAEAIETLRRRDAGWLVVELRPEDPDFLALIVESLAKPDLRIFLTPRRNGLPARISAEGLGPLVQLPHHVEPLLLDRLIPELANDAGWQPGGMMPANLFRLVENGRHEAWVRITHGPREVGDLCLRGGHAIYAEAGGAAGDVAARRMMGWGGCAYELRELPSFLRPNMDWPLIDLLDRTLGPGEADDSLDAAPGEEDFDPAALEDLAEPPEPTVFSALGIEPEGAPAADRAPAGLAPAGSASSAAGGLDIPGLAALPEDGGINEDDLGADLEPPEPDVLAQLATAAAPPHRPQPTAAGPTAAAPANGRNGGPREEIQGALDALGRSSPPVLAAALVDTSRGEMVAQYRREGAQALDRDRLQTVCGMVRPALEDLRLGEGRQVVLSGSEGTLLLLPLGRSEYVLAVRRLGAPGLWKELTACEKTVRSLVAP